MKEGLARYPRYREATMSDRRFLTIVIGGAVKRATVESMPFEF
jgi:hypothetical protein